MSNRVGTLRGVGEPSEVMLKAMFGGGGGGGGGGGAGRWKRFERCA